MNNVSPLINAFQNETSAVLFAINGVEISSQQFLSEVKTLASKLESSPKQRWALCYRDSYLFAVALFALLMSNKQPVLLPNHQPGTLQDFNHEFDAMLSDIPEIKAEKLSKTTSISNAQFKELQTITIFTSGSTGKPKKISRTLKQLTNEISILEATFGNSMTKSLIYSTVSHQHIYGLLFAVLWPLCAKRTICLPALNYPEEVEAVIHSDQPITLITGPALLSRMPDKIIDTKNLTVFSSGNLLETKTASKLQKFMNCYPIEVLGSTETGGVAFRQQLKNKNWMPFNQVKIDLDPQTQCLKIQSPFFDNDKLITSDRVIFNHDGTFQLLERADRIVKIEGKRVSLPEIENKLKEHAFVQNAYAIAKESNRQYIAVVIVLNDDGNKILKEKGKAYLNLEFKKLLSQYFERVLLPKQFRYIDKIPTNEQGKITTTDINALFESSWVKLPEIKSHEQLAEKEMTLQLFIPKELIYFKGHFPGSPILPGVVQVDWAIHFANQCFNVPKEFFLDIEQVKFTKVIQPESTISLSLKIEQHKLAFCYFHGESMHSRGKIKVGAL